MVQGLPDPSINDLLACLSQADWQLIAPHLHAHRLQTGDILHKAGEEVTQTWFPCDAASAGLQVGDVGGNAPVDVAVIGKEGAIGGIVSNGRLAAYTTAQVREGGVFMVIRTAQLEAVKSQSLHLRHWFARYSDCLLAQVFQNAACNARHTIRQRAARWLLDTAARTGSDEIRMTQERLAIMLGVGRTFITRTIQDLRAAGLLRTSRGVMYFDDRDRLRELACDCSDHISSHYLEVMGEVYETRSGRGGGKAANNGGSNGGGNGAGSGGGR